MILAKQEFHNLGVLLNRLFFIMALFTGLRLLFYAYNQAYFPTLSTFELSRLCFFSLRFDLVAIIYINALFILLSLLPIKQRSSHSYQRAQKGIFLIFNTIALSFELADVAYFSFAYRRIIGSDLKMLAKSTQQLGTIAAEYWYFILLLILLVYLLHRLYHFAERKTTLPPFHQKPQLAIFLTSLPLFFIGLRGGLQMRPVMPITASNYVDDMRLMPIPSSASLQLLFSVQQRQLEVPSYFSEEQLNSKVKTLHQAHSNTAFQAKNVMIIVLESFGLNSIGHFHKEEKNTPFLDSLLRESYYLEHTFANGLRSTQGIVAISSSIPAMMEDPLMFSAYQSNQVKSFASILKEKGYTSGFFHGANPGSMEFERFSILSGFDHFYDKQQYNNEKDYDGNWGIWDIPFFQFTAQTINQYPQPFAALLFSLTSHHPYRAEAWFEQKYPHLDPMSRSMRYTDTALQQFFQTAQQMPWFENTLFVITADHIGRSKKQDDHSKIGRYRVPILFYSPTDSLKGKATGLMQQIDILPSVMDYLNFDQSYPAFGKSVFSENGKRYAYMFDDGTYQIVDSQYILMFDGERTIGFYNYTKDRALNSDLSAQLPEQKKQMEDQLKAMIQKHHGGMVYNRLYTE